MKRLFICLMLFLMAVFSVVQPPSVCADFDEKPVAFVVMDKSGGLVDNSAYTAWRQVVKWAYHFPYYKVSEDGTVQDYISNALWNIKITKENLSEQAKKNSMDAIVIVVLYDMDETILSSVGGFNTGPYVNVVAIADLYAYKKDGDKFLQSKVRERAIKDLGNYEKPQETIRWALSKLVNTIEGRPIID